MVRPRYRILVTASREWADPWAIWTWLDGKIADTFGLLAGVDITVVHGDAPGGDQIAKLWALVRGHEHEPHPADWAAPCQEQCIPGHRRYGKGGSSTCPAAGPYRNHEMVKLGADVCGAFIHNLSKGASGCAALAKREGIPTEEFHAYSV